MCYNQVSHDCICARLRCLSNDDGRRAIVDGVVGDNVAGRRAAQQHSAVGAAAHVVRRHDVFGKGGIFQRLDKCVVRVVKAVPKKKRVFQPREHQKRRLAHVHKRVVDKADVMIVVLQDKVPLAAIKLYSCKLNMLQRAAQEVEAIVAGYCARGGGRKDDWRCSGAVKRNSRDAIACILGVFNKRTCAAVLHQ